MVKLLRIGTFIHVYLLNNALASFSLIKLDFVHSQTAQCDGDHIILPGFFSTFGFLLSVCFFYTSTNDKNPLYIVYTFIYHYLSFIYHSYHHIPLEHYLLKQIHHDLYLNQLKLCILRLLFYLLQILLIKIFYHASFSFS